MHTSEILEHMRAGAELHRDMGQIELRFPDGARVAVTHDQYDSLIEAGKIAHDIGTRYRLA